MSKCTVEHLLTSSAHHSCSISVNKYSDGALMKAHHRKCSVFAGHAGIEGADDTAEPPAGCEVRVGDDVGMGIE